MWRVFELLLSNDASLDRDEGMGQRSEIQRQEIRGKNIRKRVFSCLSARTGMWDVGLTLIFFLILFSSLTCVADL
jgi:hypothetical protein